MRTKKHSFSSFSSFSSFCGLLLCLSLASSLVNEADAKTSALSAEGVIKELYVAVGQAAFRLETGQLEKADFFHPISPSVKLSFSTATYEQDVSRALKLLGKLEKKRSLEPASAKKQASAPKKPLSRIEQLMQAERTIARNAPAPRYVMTDFDVMEAFEETRSARIAAKNFAAEADMQLVNAERQAAEQDKLAKRQLQEELQSQAAAWQDQQNQQAAEQAALIRQWKKENSFGAHMRRIFTGAIGAGISSFTGGLTTVLANDAAADLIDDILN